MSKRHWKVCFTLEVPFAHVHQSCYRFACNEYASKIAAFYLCYTDGIKFYHSNDFVIVSPGDENGRLLPKYFSKAVDLKSGEFTIVT